MSAPAPVGCRGDRGVVLVEFALVLPVLMMLLLGMVSGASAWNQSQGLGQGGRVAARYSSTLPLPAVVNAITMSTWLDGVVDRAIAAGEGTMADGVDGRAVCVAYVDPAGTAADNTYSRRINAAGTRTSGVDVCFSDGQGDGERRVQVVMERDGFLDVGFYRQTLQLRRNVVYRYEADGDI